MSDTLGVLERVMRVVQMSKIAWLDPRIRIDPKHLEIYLCIGVIPKFERGEKIGVHFLEMRSISSLQMWEDSAVDDEALVQYIEDAVSNLGMGVMLLEEAPVVVHVELS